MGLVCVMLKDSDWLKSDEKSKNLTGGQGVPGSNPGIPTKSNNGGTPGARSVGC